MSDHDTIPAPPPMKTYADSIFEPWERILILSIALDDVPKNPHSDAMRAVLDACIAVVKNMQGRTSRPQAFTMVARVNANIRALCTAPPDFVQTYADRNEMTVEEATRFLLGVAERRLGALNRHAEKRRSRCDECTPEEACFLHALAETEQ